MWPAHERRLAHLRHEQKIAKVGTAGAGQMRQAETHDRRVVVGVAGARVPVRDVGVGTELDHAERRGRSGISVALLALGADHRPDVIRQRLVILPVRPRADFRHTETGQRRRGNQN